METPHSAAGCMKTDAPSTCDAVRSEVAANPQGLVSNLCQIIERQSQQIASLVHRAGNTPTAEDSALVPVAVLARRPTAAEHAAEEGVAACSESNTEEGDEEPRGGSPNKRQRFLCGLEALSAAAQDDTTAMMAHTGGQHGERARMHVADDGGCPWCDERAAAARCDGGWWLAAGSWLAADGLPLMAANSA